MVELEIEASWSRLESCSIARDVPDVEARVLAAVEGAMRVMFDLINACILP